MNQKDQKKLLITDKKIIKWKFREIAAVNIEYGYQNPLISFLQNWGHKQAINLSKNKKGLIIDIGCGTGEFLQKLKDKRKKIGLDISPFMLKTANARLPNLVFIQADASKKIPLKSNSISTIFCIYTLEHIKNYKKCLLELERILEDSGELIISLPTENTLFAIGRYFTTRKNFEKKWGISHKEYMKLDHVSNPKEIIKYLKERFKVTHYLGIPLLLPIFPLSIFVTLRCVKKSPKPRLKT